MEKRIPDITVIIPSYKPDGKLLATVEGIRTAGFDDILVVDDGGGEEYARFFREAEEMGCTVLHHEVNRGKGAALKTAFSYFTEHRTDFIGAVTADADGQHLPKDIIAVAQEMQKTGCVILGSRDFSDPQVPARSRFGNRCTSFMFRLFIGMKVTDTQTGLRAFPRAYIRDVMGAKGDRYEYETQMLFLMKQKKIPYREKTISTVYIDDNASSHFRPIRDSLRIYSMILMFVCSSLSSALADVLLFYLFRKFVFTALSDVLAIAASSLTARVLSSLMNYFINAKTVFGGKANKGTLARYAILAVCQIAVSASLIWGIKTILSVHSPAIETCIKAIVDVTLFFVSFRIQHGWVFRDRNKKKSEEKT